MAIPNVVGATYEPSQFIRHPLTSGNQDELAVSSKLATILDWNRSPIVADRVRARAQQDGPNGAIRYAMPTGFSLTTRKYGEFPASEPTASERGWSAYLNVGVPLIEERSDIVQPPPEVISEQAYVARSSTADTSWTDTVVFSISNTLAWSLDGSANLSFGGKISGTLQQQLALGQQASETLSSQKSISQAVSVAAAAHTSSTSKMHAHRDNMGPESENTNAATNTTTSTTTATGTTTASGTGTSSVTSATAASATGELNAQLAFGIRAQVSGSLTSSWSQTSTVSGPLNCRAVVRATQRRQVKRYDYQLPITVGGYVALYYPEPVDFHTILNWGGVDMAERNRILSGDPSSRTNAPRYVQVVVFPISVIGLIPDHENYIQKGWAEVVSTLVGEHEVFEHETLTLAGRSSYNFGEANLYKY